MRVQFEEIFRITNSGITPRLVVEIEETKLSPGEYYGDEVTFGGVNLTKQIGKDLEIKVDQSLGIITIIRFYN